MSVEDGDGDAAGAPAGRRGSAAGDAGYTDLLRRQRVPKSDPRIEAIGAEGLARVDVFLADEGVVVNEINTMPGFTPISMFPTCWLNTDLSYPELITELIEVGHARGIR